MVEKFIKSACYELIEKSGYIPVRDQYGNYLMGSSLNILYRHKNSVNIIVDLINGDSLSADEIKNRLEQDRNLLFSYSSRGNFYFYAFFIFEALPDDEKIMVINGNMHKEYGGTKNISCLSMSLASCEVIRHFKIPPTAYSLDRTLENLALSGSYRNEVLPDLYQLVKSKEASYRIEYKTDKPYATYCFLALNIAIYVILTLLSKNSGENFYDLLDKYGSKYNSRILAGEYWRLFTPIFLHGSDIHLLMNSYFLYSIGRTVEGMYGSLKFVFVYIIAGIMGNIASFALSQYTSVGASGALMGMLGALLYYGLENPTQFKRYFGYNVIANIVIMVIFGLSNPRIDNYAHFGGLTGGFLASGIAGLGKVRYKYLYRYTAVVLTVAVAAAGLVHGFSK
jgi:rhomboid protease GluP